MWLKRILIIEDDFDLAIELQRYLMEYGYDVQYLNSFDRVMEEISSMNPNLIILDINLGDKSGYKICYHIRNTHKIPIMFLTGRDRYEDEIKAINLGGDDYLRKPFSKEVLLARINRLMKTHSFEYLNELKHGNIILNISKSTLINDATGHSINLSNTEFQIMHYLMLHKNEIISRESLMDYLWNNKYYVDENALNVNLSRLRKKLGSINEPEIIKTIHGKGLRLC